MKKEICNNNYFKCFCGKEKGHNGIHKCRCGGSWDNKGYPHSFPNIFLGFNTFPNTDEEKEILKQNEKI